MCVFLFSRQQDHLLRVEDISAEQYTKSNRRLPVTNRLRCPFPRENRGTGKWEFGEP